MVRLRHRIAWVPALVAACSSFGSNETPSAAPDAGSADGGGADTGSTTDPPSGCHGCQPILVTSKVSNVYGLVADGDSLYAGAAYDGASVWRVAKAGGEDATTVLASSRSWAVGLAVQGDDLFAGEGNGLFKYSKLQPGTPVPFDGDGSSAVLADASHVFSCHYEGTVGDVPHDVIQLANGARKVLASGVRGCASLASNGTYLYYGSVSSIRRAKIDVEDSDEQVRPYTARQIALDEKYVYSVAFLDASVRRASIEPGTGFEVIATNPDAENTGVGNIAVDATHVYWTIASSKGKVLRVEKGGGKIDVIAEGMNTPSAIALDDEYVYWAEAAGNRIWKRQK